MGSISDAMRDGERRREEKKKEKGSTGKSVVVTSGKDGSLKIDLEAFDRSIEIPAKPEETDEQAHVVKELVERFAAKLMIIEDQLAEVKADANWRYKPNTVIYKNGLENTCREAYNNIDKYRKDIPMLKELIDEAIAEKRRLAEEAVLEEAIRGCDPLRPEVVRELIKKVAVKGYGQILSGNSAEAQKVNGKFPAAMVVFLNEKIYLMPKSGDYGKKIICELKRLVDRFYNNLRSGRIIDTEMERIMSQGDPDLRGLKNGKAGVYRLCFPMKNENGKVARQGAGLVRVFDSNEEGEKKSATPFLVVEIVDGAGALKWMTEHIGLWVPAKAAHTGRVIKDKTPAKLYAPSSKLAETLAQAIGIYERGLNKGPTEAEEKKDVEGKIVMTEADFAREGSSEKEVATGGGETVTVGGDLVKVAD